MVAVRRMSRLLPGLVLCALIGLAAAGLDGLETRLFGHAPLEALALAVLLGVLVRALWTPGEVWGEGIAFGSKVVLEIAVALLGATVSVVALARMGPGLVVGIAAVVALSIAGGYGLARGLGLPKAMAVLVACGNSICGNSAIAAVAPVIGARSEDVAAAIAFTAVLGVGVMLGVAPLAGAMGLSPAACGAFAGLTVYAVPQVLAAAAPAGVLAVQTGALVKMVRVLALGPVCLLLGLARGGEEGGRGLDWRRLAPWFILVFLVLAAGRTLGLVPDPAAALAGKASVWLTIASMAALGLGADVRALARAGLRVCLAAALSLGLLAALAIGLLRLLGLA